MPIYSQVLGEEFNQLHPMLQQRYKHIEKEPYEGSGVMKRISRGAKWMSPLMIMGARRKLLFPEKGTFIPFTIRHKPQTGEKGEDQVHWERVFYFKGKKRYFNALMSLDAERGIIKDYLGEPSVMYSDLALTVLENGGLHIQSKRQRVVIGEKEIPLPRFLQGVATVVETFNDERNVYEIKVSVQNPIMGTIFSYEGEFTEDA
ncbi:DUF4166 domain-containing protein [Pontibacillus sp. ALD_SL1]|uniref:DUF4166 domain-containing protein n=1 Tax=Pontibacillus sp. ALD_SL1 TaxID=2777185 RepID=UPI001A964779|nr:DUF4166 domain-containing protein [Pontibacillus sp. ALD_SL1]QSS98805.1 DUF4166 domain-containing protein [Pontibacillus sp. ALD_SL1]